MAAPSPNPVTANRPTVVGKQHAEAIPKLDATVDSIVTQQFADTRKQAEACLKKNWPFLVSVIKLQKRELNREIISSLSIKDAILLAQVILILCAEEGQISQHALRNYLSRSFSLQSFQELWKECGVNPSHIKSFNALADAVINLSQFEYSHLPQSNSVLSTAQYQKLLECISSVTIKIWKHLIPFLDETSISLSNEILKVDGERQRIQSNRKCVKKESGNNTGRAYGRLSLMYADRISDSLRLFPLYVQSRLPKITAFLACMNMDSPNVTMQIRSILSYVNKIKTLAEQLTNQTALKEGLFAINCGQYPKSQRALELSQEFVKGGKKASLSFINSLFQGMGVTRISKENDDNVMSFADDTVIYKMPLLYQITLGFLRKEVNNGSPNTAEQLLKSNPDLVKIYQDAWEIFKEILTNHAIYHLGKEDGNNYVKIEVNILLIYIEQLHKRTKEIATNKEVADEAQAFVMAFLFLRERLQKCIGTNADSEFKAFIERKANDRKEMLAKSEREYRNRPEERRKIWGSIADDKGFIERYAKMTSNTESFLAAVNILSNVVQSLSFAKEQFDKEDELSASAKADDFLHMLELEENEEIAERELKEKLSFQKQEKEKQGQEAIQDAGEAIPAVEQLTVTAPAATASIVSNIISMPDLAESPFNTQASKLIHELSHYFAQWRGRNPAELVLPADVANQRLSLSELAEYQQLYAMDCLGASLEMFEHCHGEEKRIASQMVLLWGYLTLEQGATAEFSKRFPRRILLHDLSKLLKDLGIDLNNHWIKHANRHTLSHRYPFCYRVGVKSLYEDALVQIQQANPNTTEGLYQKLTTWVEDGAKLGIAVIARTHSAAQASLLKRIHEVLERFQKHAAGAGKAGEEYVGKEFLEKETAAELEKCSRELYNAFSSVQERIKIQETEIDQESIKPLRNASHHLVNLMAATALFKRFPQQRFLHVHLHLQLLSTQYFAENIGFFLSTKRGDGWLNHSLALYCKEYGLGEGMEKELSDTLAMIDIGKGSEYLYRHTPINQQAIAQMNLLGELYAGAKEARLMGEKTTASRGSRKPLASLQREIANYTQRYAALAIALTDKHLKP